MPLSGRDNGRERRDIRHRNPREQLNGGALHHAEVFAVQHPCAEPFAAF